MSHLLCPSSIFMVHDQIMSGDSPWHPGLGQDHKATGNQWKMFASASDTHLQNKAEMAEERHLSSVMVTASGSYSPL